MVSIDAISRLGILPRNNVVQNQIKVAKICSPTRSFEIRTANQKIVVLERREFDKHIALQSTRLGANIRTRCSLRNTKYTVESSDKSFHIITTDGEFRSRYFVDARGISSLVQNDRSGVLLATIRGLCFLDEKDTVIVEFDKNKYPGFLRGLSPPGKEAGRLELQEINQHCACSRLIWKARVAVFLLLENIAPIWVKGPIDKFIDGRTVVIGDAAGKPNQQQPGDLYLWIGRNPGTDRPSPMQ